MTFEFRQEVRARLDKMEDEVHMTYLRVMELHDLLTQEDEEDVEDGEVNEEDVRDGKKVRFKTKEEN